MVPLCPIFYYLAWSRLACMLPSRCMLPSPRSAPSSTLSPIHVPVSPVARAKRRKQCPVALAPTPGRSASSSQPLDLLKSALSGIIILAFMYMLKLKRSLYSDTVRLSRTKRNTPAQPDLDAFARASTSARPRGGRAPVCPCLYPCPCTHGEIRGRTGPERRTPKPPN